MSMTLSLQDQENILKYYHDMTVFEMSAVFDLDALAVSIFMQKRGLKAKTDPLSKKQATIKPRILRINPGPEKTMNDRPPAVYSNKSHAYLVEYYSNL